MSKITLVACYLLALMMILFGLNEFLGFMPMPELTGEAATYMATIGGSYILPTLGVLYLLSGVLLAANKAVGLATILLAPLAYNAFMFHLTLDPANIAGAAVFLALVVVVMLGNASKYKSLLA